MLTKGEEPLEWRRSRKLFSGIHYTRCNLLISQGHLVRVGKFMCIIPGEEKFTLCVLHTLTMCICVLQSRINLSR